ncbi:MAG: LysR family transcriptional regulator substrate-binding protein, partial [Mobilitalea sp.]
RYPQVELLIKFGSRDKFLHSLKDNILDIAFFVDQKIVESDFVSIFEIQEPMVLLCAPDHPFAKMEKVYPKDLSDESLILTEPSCGYRILFNSVMSQFHVKARSVIETGNVQAIKQLTLSGMGITFLPQTAVEEELQQKRLVKLKWMGPEFCIYTQALHYKTKWMSASLKAFIDLMHEMDI